MNKTYKVVWNDALGLFQVVNELTRGRRKSAGGRNPDASDVVGGASGLRISALAAAVSSLLLITTPSFAADLTINDLNIGTTSTTTALTTEALPDTIGDKVLLNAPAAGMSNLFQQGKGIDYKVSDTNLTIDAASLTAPEKATIDLDSAAKGVYAFNLSGTSSNPLMLKAQLTELQLQDGQTFVLVRSGSDPEEFTAVIIGNGNLKTQGDMTLSGVNTYTGKTEVASGTVTMGSVKAFGESTDLTVPEGAAVDMNSNDLELTKVAGTGTVNVNGGTLTLNLTSAAPDLTAKLTGGGKVVIAMSAPADTVNFKHADTDFSGDYEIIKGHVNLDTNGKTALGSAATVKLVSADHSVGSIKMTVNDAAMLKNVSVDDATIVFAFGDKKLGETGAPKLNVTNLTAEATGTTRVDVTQDLNQGSVNWLQADDNAESQVLISGGIVNPTGIEVYLNGTTDVTAGTTLKQDVTNGTTTATVAKAEYEVTVTRTATEVGMKKTLKSLTLEDNTGEGLVITRPAAPANDDDITLKTKLTGTGNVTFDPLGQNIIVKPADPVTNPNDYTGKTFIKKGEVIAQTQNAFGNTSELNIATDGKVSMNDHQQVGALVTAADSTVDIKGNRLTIGSGESKLAGKLEGSGNIDFDNSNVTVLKNKALGSVALSSTGTGASNLTLAADGDYDNKLSGNFNLTIGDAAPAAPVEVELTGNNTGMSGKVGFKNNSKLTVSDLPNRIGTSSVDTTDGELHVKDAGTTIANTITGSGKLHLKAAGKPETTFAGSGDEGFTGTVEAEDIKFTARGTAKQFKNADVVLGDRAEYKADDSQTVKSMKATSGSTLDFTGTVYPLTVTNDLTLEDGSDVKADLPGTFTKDILDQITGDSVVLARAGGNVSIDSNAKLNGITGEQEMTGSLGAGAADATYKTKLDGTSGLAVTRKLTALDLQAGKTLDIDAAGTTNKNLSVAVSGSGNLNFNGGDVEFSSGGNTYTGTTTLSAGTLKLSGANALGKTSLLDVQAGKATVAADQDLNASLNVASGAQLELDDTKTLKLTNGTSVVNGALAGSGGLWISGGKLDVDGSNGSFAGTTTLDAQAVANLKEADGLGGVNATLDFKDQNSSVTLKKTGAADIQAKLSGEGTVEVDLGGADNALTLSNTSNAFTGKLKVKNAGLMLAGNEATTLAGATLETGDNAKVVVKTGDTTVAGVTLAGGELAFEQLTVGDTAASAKLTANHVVVDAGKVTNVSIGTLAGSTTPGTMSVNVLDADNAGEKDTLISGSVAGPLSNLHLTSALGSVTQTLTGAEATWNFDQELVATANGLGLNRKLTKLELTDNTSAAGYEINSSGATDKTLTAQLTGSGNVTFKGGQPITVDNVANDYTGKTTIVNTVVAGSNNALGQTSALDIESGGQFNLNGKTQTVGNLTTASGNALSGSGLLTLEGTSAIYGANAAFTAATTLASSSNTTLFDAEGLGKGGISFADASAGLILKDLGTGAVSNYANSLSGAGTLKIDNSNVELTGGNSGFSGSVAFDNNGKLNVSTPNTQIGSAKVDSTGGTLALSTSADLIFNNKLTGNGTVEVNTAGHSVTLTDADAFAGTLKLDRTSIDGGANAGVIDAAKLELANKSSLTVKAGGQTIDQLTVDGTSTLEFNDKFAPGMDFAGKLTTTNGLTLENGAKIALDRASVESTKATGAGNDNRNLLDQDVGSNSVTLATGYTTAGNVKLVDKAGNEISNASTATVLSNGEEVADATYDFTVNGDPNGLHVGYQLQKVDVREGKALVLDTTGATDKTFSAELAGKGGLTVKGDTVTLTHVNNTYTGETTVKEGNLIADAANALGNTSKVTVDGDKTLTIKANQEHVGTLDAVKGTVDLLNGASLTLNNGESKIAEAAELKGAAGTTLVVNGGSLDIKGANSSYMGNAHLKNGARATLDNVAGLGNDTGSTVTLDEGTTLGMTHTGDADIKSKLAGSGVLEVGLNAETDNLSFSNAGNAFTGTLVLTKGQLALAGDADNNRKTLETATLKTGANADVVVSSGSNKLGGLTLDGGKIGFGKIGLNGTTSAGYVDLAGTGKLVIDSDTKVDLSLSASANLTAGGSELLSMDDGAHVALVTNSSQTINNVERLKFTGTASQTSTLTQSGLDVAKAAWELGDNKFATANEGHDLVVNYKLKELNLLVTTPGSGLVVTNTTGDDQTLSAKLTGDGNIRFYRDPSFSGGTITVNNVNNNYTGITYIERGEVIAGADNALGQTKELNIRSGALFNLDSRSQTVGKLITADENALKSTGGSLTLTDTGSVVNGANAALKAAITLNAGSKTTINNVLGLGTGDVAIRGMDDDVLKINGATGNLANNLSGTGGLMLEGGANVKLTGVNSTYTGKITANLGTTLTAEGNVAEHIGSGNLHVDGTANLTQSGDWKLNNLLTGSGTVKVSAEKAGGNGTFALGTRAGTGFTGNLELTNANMTLDDDLGSEGKVNADALANATLTLDANGIATVKTGNSSTGSLTMAGGTLAFEGSLTPGVHQSEPTPANPSTAEAHLTVKDLNLSSGTVRVDISTPVEADYGLTKDSLTMQDVLDLDNGKVTTKLVTATGTVSGTANSIKLVDKDGIDIRGGKTLDIRDGSGGLVAKGDYGLGLSVNGQDFGIAYQLTKVDINSGKSLTLKGTSPSDNELTAQLTGSGGMKIDAGTIKLSNALNDYTGITEVLSGATLEAGSNNAFGHTSGLDNKGTVKSNGFDQTIYGSVDNAGTLDIAGGNWTVNKDLNQNGTLAVTADANLSVKGNAVLAGTSAVNGSVLTVEETATVTGTTQLENATVNFGNGGSAAEGTLVGTTGNKLNFNGGEFSMLGANAGLTAASTVASGAVLTLEKSADAVGKNGSVDVAGQLKFKGANGDFSNALKGNGKVDFTGTNAAFTADNSAFSGTITLDEASNLSVTAVNQLGKGDASGIGAATIQGSGLVTMTSDAALNVDQIITGSVNIDKLGAGDLVMADHSLGSTGIIRMKGGVLRFGTPGAGASAAGSVELDAGTGMSAFGTVGGDLTVNAGASAFVSGDASAKAGVTAPKTLKVNGRTVNNGTLQIGHLDGPATATIGSRFETNDYASGNGTIVVNALLNGDDDSKLDTFKANGAASGTGKLTVNTVDAAGLGITRNVNGVTVAEFGEGTVDLSLTDEIKVNGLYYRLMKTDDGSRYYLSNQIQSAGTEAMSTSMLMQPEAGARAALAYAADQAFNISLHDHVGETLYIDQLTGEERLTSVWMAQTGDWTRWRDGTGQLYNKGQTLTTHIGGDLITWGPADKHRLSVGLLGGYSYADFDSTSDLTGWNAKGTFNGYSVGAYLAWQNVAEDGPFGSVQLRWNSFRNSVQGDGYEKEKYTSDGISAALEAGWNQQLLHMKLENGTSALWRVQPHVGVYWSNISADEQTDANGQRFVTDGDNNVTLRLGGRTSITFAETQVPGVVDPGLTFYVEGNWIRNTGNYTTTVFNQNGESTADLTADNLGEVRFGVEGHVNRNIQLWGDVHHRVGDQSYRSTGVMLGGKYVW